MNSLKRLAVPIVVAVVFSGCALSLRNPSIADLKYNASRYQHHTVSIHGVVTNSWGIPFVPFGFYKVDDGTGEVTVLSQGSRVPSRGAQVRVRGRVDDLAVVGGRPLGLHVREESLHVR